MVGSSAFPIAIVMTLLLVGGCFATSEEFDPALEGVFNFPAGRAMGDYLGERYGGAASWNIAGLYIFMNYIGHAFAYNGPTTVELLAFTTPPSDGHCGVNGTKCLKYSRQFTCFGARPERELLDPASFDRLIELNDTHTAIICSKFVQSYTNGNYQPVTLPRVYIINPQTGEDQFVAEHSQNMSTELVATAVNTSFTVIPASPQQNVTVVNAALIALQGINTPGHRPVVFVLNLLTQRFDMYPQSFNGGVVRVFTSTSGSASLGVEVVVANSSAVFAYPLPSFYDPTLMLWKTHISSKGPAHSRTVLYASDWSWGRHLDFVPFFGLLSATYNSDSPHPTHFYLDILGETGTPNLRVPLNMFVDEFPLLYNATINKDASASNVVFKQFIVDSPLSATNIVVVRVTNILFKHANDANQQYLGCGMMAVDVVNVTLKWAKYHEMPVTPEEAQAYRDGDDVPLACHWLPSNLLSKQLTPPRSPAFELSHWFVVQTKTDYIVEFMDPFFGTSSFNTVVRPDPGWMPITSHVAPKMQGVAVHRLHKGGYSLLSLDFTLKKDKNLIRTVLVDLLNKPVPSSGNNAYTTVLRTMTINPAANTTRLFGGGTFQLLEDVNEDDANPFNLQGMLFAPMYENHHHVLIEWEAKGLMQIYNMSKSRAVPVPSATPSPHGNHSTPSPDSNHTTPSPTSNHSTGNGTPNNDDDKKTLTPAAKGLIAAVVIFFVGAIVGILIHRRKQNTMGSDTFIEDETDEKTASLNKYNSV